MKRFIIPLVLTLTNSFYLYAEDITSMNLYNPIIPFAGEYKYWSDSRDFESVEIIFLGELYRAEIRCGGQTMKLICSLRSEEIVSEPLEDIIYIFRMNGENELRMRTLHTDRDRPEDIEWVFFRKF